MQNKLFFWNPAFQSTCSFCQVAPYRSYSKNSKNMNLQSILNKNSPEGHMELEFDKFGVAKNLVKFVVHLFKIKLLQKKILLTRCPNNK